MSFKPIVDILVPVYNCEKYIKKCIESLICQTYKNINIIIANDGSTDKSLEIINNLKRKNYNIIVYNKKNEQNISKTRNFLLSKIISEYFTFFDADDFAEPTYIEELMSNLIAYKADLSMCGKSRHHDKFNKNLSKVNKKLNKLYFFDKNEAFAELLSSNLYNGTVYCKIFKTSLIKNIKFNESIHYGEDLDFLFKFMQNASRFVFSNKKLYHYIIRKNSIVTSKFKPTKLTCLDCYENIINSTQEFSETHLCAKSMQGLIAIELLFYMWRDHYKDKQTKRRLKQIIKSNIPFIKQNKRLPPILKLAPIVCWLTKFM